MGTKAAARILLSFKSVASSVPPLLWILTLKFSPFPVVALRFSHPHGRIPIMSVEDAKSEVLKVYQEAWEVSEGIDYGEDEENEVRKGGRGGGEQTGTTVAASNCVDNNSYALLPCTA